MMEEERGNSLDEKRKEAEGEQCRRLEEENTRNLMTEVKADASAVQGRFDKGQVMFENREPYIVEKDSLSRLKDLVKHTIDLVENKMFLSFSSMADMMTYTGMVEEKTSVGKASSEMCGVGEQCMR